MVGALKSIFFILTAICLLSGCAKNNKNTASIKDENYIFFLHNKFIELFDLDAKHPEYGRAEYKEILDSFRTDGFIVISEKRPKDTDATQYAKKVTKQIDSLLKFGVKPDHITVIGTSKGGYIAQYVSTYLANPDVNFVFIGSFQENDIKEMPEINFCGNILTIYEKSDTLGVSAIHRQETSKLSIKHFKEIELNTNLKHGFLFKAMSDWIEPCKMWAKRDYDLRSIEKN